MFYGDETLSSLLKHGKSFSEMLDNFDFLLKEEPVEILEEEDTNEEETRPY